MKIGIMGTHGTGKTTYAFQLAYTMKRDYGCGVCVVSETARRCPYPINANTTATAQRWIFHTQMISEMDAMRFHDIVICDRTALDNLAYAKRAGFNFLVDAYFPIAIDWMRMYDKIVFLRPSFPLVDDGVRDVDPIFQEDIDTILTGWIEEYSIPIVKEDQIEIE